MILAKCPICGHEFSASAGKTVCPACNHSPIIVKEEIADEVKEDAPVVEEAKTDAPLEETKSESDAPAASEEPKVSKKEKKQG